MTEERKIYMEKKNVVHAPEEILTAFQWFSQHKQAYESKIGSQACFFISLKYYLYRNNTGLKFLSRHCSLLLNVR